MNESLEVQLSQALLYLERYYPKSYEKLEKRLLIAQDKILQFISTTTNQKQIRAIIRQELQNAFSDFSDNVIYDMEQVSGLAWNNIGAIMASGFVSDELSKGFKKFKSIDKSIKDNLSNPNRLILGSNIEDMKNQMLLGTNQKLRAAILGGFTQNQGIDQINKQVKETIANLTRNQARTITRTIVLNAIDEAQSKSLEYFDDEIIEWEFWSVMDSRTSPYCLMADGYRTKNKKTAKYKTKTHYNCRSVWKPVTKLSKEIEDKERRIVSWDTKTVNHRDGTKSTKFSVDTVKQLPKDASKERIFKAWSKEEQIRFLGKTRYKLFNDGKITLKEAINISKNKLIPLDELQKIIKQ